MARRNRNLKMYGRVFKGSLIHAAAGELAYWENNGESESIESAEYDFLLGIVSFYFTTGHGPYQVPSTPYEWLNFLRAGSKGAFVNQHWLS